MIFASGFIEANEPADAGKVRRSLEERDVEVTGMNGEKVVFLIERQTPAEVKAVLDSLKDIDGARSVYLAYFSLEEGDHVIGLIIADDSCDLLTATEFGYGKRTAMTEYKVQSEDGSTRVQSRVPVMPVGKRARALALWIQ